VPAVLFAGLASQRKESRAAFAEARRRLEGTHWTVTLEEQPPVSLVVFEHELTTRCSLALGPSPLTALDALDRFFAHREFEVIAAAPSDRAHVDLLQRLRATTTSGEWTPSGFSLLSRILASTDVLSEGEAQWLQWSGRPWRDDDWQVEIPEDG
jgi:hypothetical protein